MSELNADNFEQHVKQGNAVIDFYAEWCGPCKIMDPMFNKLSQEISDVNFFKLNVDSNQQTAASYDVRSIPTIVFLKDGKELDKVIGLLQEQEFKDKIKQVFK